MKASELREKSTKELNETLVELLKEQFNLSMQRGVGEASRPDQFQSVRKNIARVKTIINEQRGNAS
ncbi:MAG: 50S ribosomal protein L29 [Gammaproteobacteria bacterium]|nr:50S ribosomal protein L29 [Gammaproteobacteria bacterium]